MQAYGGQFVLAKMNTDAAPQIAAALQDADDQEDEGHEADADRPVHEVQVLHRQPEHEQDEGDEDEGPADDDHVSVSSG